MKKWITSWHYGEYLAACGGVVYASEEFSKEILDLLCYIPAYDGVSC